MAKRRAPLPSKAEIREFIRESPKPVGKREIARAFNLRGDERVDLKRMLRELEREGEVERGRGRRLGRPGALPEVTVIEVTGTDEDGELLGRPVAWRGEGEPPSVYVAPERGGLSALAAGDRVLARLKRSPDGALEARIIRVIAGRPQKVLAVFKPGPGGGRLRSTDRRHKSDFFVSAGDTARAKPGDLVEAEALPGRHHGQPRAKVVRRIGHADEPGAISLIAIHSRDIPVDFTPEARAQARAARPVPLGRRTDLRDVPLVTIDGPTARDFDDAVWAEPDTDPRNKDGWHLMVAIADVVHYVRPGDALDECAYERGNSVYFPDRVVPMLPEQLSADLCSLRPEEDRACLVAHVWIDRRGDLRRHRFERGLMRSAARLTYEQVQAARDGYPDETTAPLVDTVVAPLYGAFEALRAARQRRGTLDLDLPERAVVFDDDGQIEKIVPEPRYDSHRLIEEFMIAANVAAAETLEARDEPCMYRVHDSPDPLKVEALREFLESLGYRLAKGQVLKPQHFTGILRQAAERGQDTLVSELVLRAQSQAQYSPENIGHFGLALRRYCHFTSPIRRYSDVLVHRALVRGLGLGEGGLTDHEAGRFAEMGEHISNTERRAVAAERDANDRYIVAFLEDRVGATFRGRITGVTRFGLFVCLDETGADGLVPLRALDDDYYVHDEHRHCLVGRRTGRAYTLGDQVVVRLALADAVSGGLLFEIEEHEPMVRHAGAKKPGRMRRPGGGRGARAAERAGGRRKDRTAKGKAGKAGASGKAEKKKSGKAAKAAARQAAKKSRKKAETKAQKKARKAAKEKKARKRAQKKAQKQGPKPKAAESGGGPAKARPGPKAKSKTRATGRSPAGGAKGAKPAARTKTKAGAKAKAGSRKAPAGGTRRGGKGAGPGRKKTAGPGPRKPRGRTRRR